MATASVSAAIEARGLDCGHGARVVVKSVELQFPPGSVTAILGPNGSGKSTLLKTLAGSLPALKGEVLLGGRPLSTHSARESARLIGFVPQEEEPQYAFSVAEVVTMGRLPYADSLFDSREDIDAAALAMQRAGCAELADRSVLELSGGELQRVLFARALAQTPRVLLLDEPTSHLDVRHALDLIETLQLLAAEGVAVLTAIHDLNLAARLVGNAVLLADGKISEHGKVEEVLASENLDQTFGVRFQRVQVGARLVLIPEEQDRG